MKLSLDPLRPSAMRPQVPMPSADALNPVDVQVSKSKIEQEFKDEERIKPMTAQQEAVLKTGEKGPPTTVEWIITPIMRIHSFHRHSTN